MTHQSIIQKMIDTVSRLPQEKAMEVADYAQYILQKYEDDSLQTGIQKLASESKSFSFLNDEEDIYTLKDLKEKY